jgi:hypothetical protein
MGNQKQQQCARAGQHSDGHARSVCSQADTGILTDLSECLQAQTPEVRAGLRVTQNSVYSNPTPPKQGSFDPYKDGGVYRGTKLLRHASARRQHHNPPTPLPLRPAGQWLECNGSAPGRRRRSQRPRSSQARAATQDPPHPVSQRTHLQYTPPVPSTPTGVGAIRPSACSCPRACAAPGGPCHAGQLPSKSAR